MYYTVLSLAGEKWFGKPPRFCGVNHGLHGLLLVNLILLGVIVSTSSEKSIVDLNLRKSQNSEKSPDLMIQSLISPLNVAQCRANCLLKFKTSEGEMVEEEDGEIAGSSDFCFKHYDCFSCWRNCEQLEPKTRTNSADEIAADSFEISPTRRICSQPQLCLAGCQIACNFYDTFDLDRRSTMSKISRQNVLHFNKEQGKIKWPRKPAFVHHLHGNSKVLEGDTLVYVVMQEYPDHKWRQITQTTRNEIKVPKGLVHWDRSNKLGSIQVLLVNPDGAVSMFTPLFESLSNSDKKLSSISTTTSSTSPEKITTTTLTQKTTLKNALISEPQPNTDTFIDTDSSSIIPDETTTTVDVIELLQTEKTPEVEQFDWNLRKVSLSYSDNQKFLVNTELAWDSPTTTDTNTNPLENVKNNYLVTWELSGGGLKGHLVTDSNSVSLSLWPNTVYIIQVELFGHGHDKEYSPENPENPLLPGQKPPTSFVPDYEADDSSVQDPRNRSLPLVVDTSEAGYTDQSITAKDLHRVVEVHEKSQSQALVKSGTFSPYFETGDKSFGDLVNVVLAVVLSSMIFVLVSLLLALAFKIFKKNLTINKRDPFLLQEQDLEADLDTEDEEYIRDLRASKKLQKDTSNGSSNGPGVSVISTTVPTTSSTANDVSVSVLGQNLGRRDTLSFSRRFSLFKSTNNSTYTNSNSSNSSSTPNRNSSWPILNILQNLRHKTHIPHCNSHKNDSPFITT